MIRTKIGDTLCSRLSASLPLSASTIANIQDGLALVQEMLTRNNYQLSVSLKRYFLDVRFWTVTVTIQTVLDY